MQPYRMIRLSKVAEPGEDKPYQMARKRINLIRRNLERVGIDPGEWSYTVEKNPEGTGYHAHCLQHGGYVSQNALQIACDKSHAGIPYINAIKRKGRWTSQYGMKGFGADGYGMKTFRPNADMREALRINGGAVEHHSTRFFEIKGKGTKVREVERIALATMNEGKKLAYVGCHPSRTSDILKNPQLRRQLIRDVERRNAERVAYGR